MLYWVHFISCSALLLTIPIIWEAILLYNYCLTFIAEVERCWVIRQLSWGLGFFYLNRYLTLLSYIPIMLQHFWSTSNPKKPEVSILLFKSPSPEVRWEGTDAHLPDVGIHPSLALKDSDEI